MAMWLEQPVQETVVPGPRAYRPGDRFVITIGVRVRRLRAVGMLGRHLVWSQVCPKRFHVERLKAEIQWRLKYPRRRPRLPR